MRRNRYTLVELVTVTAILLVVLAVGTARLSVELLDGGPYQKAEQLRRIAALCRRQAAATGKTCAVEFDPARRRLFFGKEQVTYPQELRILRNGEELRALCCASSRTAARRRPRSLSSATAKRRRCGFPP